MATAKKQLLDSPLEDEIYVSSTHLAMNRSLPISEKSTRAIGLVVLAAGASTRLGQPKQLLAFQGQTLLVHAIQVALASVCDPVVVVLGAYIDLIQPTIAHLPVQIVHNARWREGLRTSIQMGVQTLEANSELEGVVLILCDQPFLSPSVINQLVAVNAATGQAIVACRYGKTVGVPALFDRTLFPVLASLQGMEGAKSIITRYPSVVTTILFEQGEVDVDTPAAYEALQTLLASKSAPDWGKWDESYP